MQRAGALAAAVLGESGADTASSPGRSRRVGSTSRSRSPAALTVAYPRTPPMGRSTSVAWSPNSHWLLVTNASGLAVASASGPAYRYQLASEAVYIPVLAE